MLMWVALMSTDLSKLFFLVVDDNRHMQKIVSAILHAFGIHNIVTADSAKAGLKVLENEPIDVVICDDHMPEMSGREFCRTVRDGDNVTNPYVPIIVLTAFSQRQNVIEARDSGATEFCCKPVSSAALYQRIAAVINNPRQFIKAKGYSGPDRRRHKQSEGMGLNRRDSDVELW